MNIGRFLAATVAYGVVVTVVATVWHESVFGAYYYPFNIFSAAANPNIPLAAIGSFIEGGVLSYLVQRFAPAHGRVAFGVTMGLLLCLFASSYAVFQVAALEDVQGAGRGMFLLLEGTAMLVYGVLGGAIVGAIHRHA